MKHFNWTSSSTKLFKLQIKIQETEKNYPRQCRNFQRLLCRKSQIQLFVINQILQIQFRKIKNEALAFQDVKKIHGSLLSPLMRARTAHSQASLSKEYQFFLTRQIFDILWVFALYPILENRKKERRKRQNLRTSLTGLKSSKVYKIIYRFLKKPLINYIILSQFSNFFNKKNKNWILANILIEKNFFFHWLKMEKMCKYPKVCGLSAPDTNTSNSFIFFNKVELDQLNFIGLEKINTFSLKKVLENFINFHFINTYIPKMANFLTIKKGCKAFHRLKNKKIYVRKSHYSLPFVWTRGPLAQDGLTASQRALALPQRPKGGKRTPRLLLRLQSSQGRLRTPPGVPQAPGSPLGGSRPQGPRLPHLGLSGEQPPGPKLAAHRACAPQLASRAGKAPRSLALVQCKPHWRRVGKEQAWRAQATLGSLLGVKLAHPMDRPGLTQRATISCFAHFQPDKYKLCSSTDGFSWSKRGIVDVNSNVRRNGEIIAKRTFDFLPLTLREKRRYKRLSNFITFRFSNYCYFKRFKLKQQDYFQKYKNKRCFWGAQTPLLRKQQACGSPLGWLAAAVAAEPPAGGFAAVAAPPPTGGFAAVAAPPPTGGFAAVAAPPPTGEAQALVLRKQQALGAQAPLCASPLARYLLRSPLVDSASSLGKRKFGATFQFNSYNECFSNNWMEYYGFFLLPLETKKSFLFIQKLFDSYAQKHGLHIKFIKLYSLSQGIDFFGWFFIKKANNFIGSISRINIQSHQKELKSYLKNSKNQSMDNIIFELNKKIFYWNKFYNCSIQFSKVSSQMNDYLFWLIWYWLKKRHQNKASKWLYARYWKKSTYRQWIFSDSDHTLIFYKF